MEAESLAYQNDDDDGFQRQANDSSQPRARSVSYCQLMGTPRIIFAALSAGLGNMVYGQLEPILALRLKDFDASTMQTGLCLSIYGFIYIIGTLIVPQIPERIEKRFIMMTSALCMGLFLTMVGPSQLLGFRESMGLLIAGLVITANFLAPLAIPALPEMMNAIREKYPKCNLELAGNYAGGLLNAGLNLGQIIGLFFGASTCAALNFRLT